MTPVESYTASNIFLTFVTVPIICVKARGKTILSKKVEFLQS